MMCLPPVTGMTCVVHHVVGDADRIQLRQQRPNVSSVGRRPGGVQRAAIANHESQADVVPVLSDGLREEIEVGNGRCRKDDLSRVNRDGSRESGGIAAVCCEVSANLVANSVDQLGDRGGVGRPTLQCVDIDDLNSLGTLFVPEAGGRQWRHHLRVVGQNRVRRDRRLTVRNGDSWDEGEAVVLHRSKVVPQAPRCGIYACEADAASDAAASI